MAITTITPENSRLLQEIADTLARAKKIVVVTGAGISSNCGIPDFRSKNGLYSLIDSAYNSRLSSKPRRASNVKGKDLFDSRLWQDELSTSVFYTFIASLRRTIVKDIKGTTATHKFIRSLRDKRKLVRCYTQNIDGLETRESLCSDLARGNGNRGRFTKKSMQVVEGKHHNAPGRCLDGGCEVVQLHGDLNVLRCTLCRNMSLWEDGRTEAIFLGGNAPVCPSCVSEDSYRRDRGKRGTTVGTLRPNIILYGEEHPMSDAIFPIITHDLSLGPDVLLILGTSLKVHGLKNLVREFSKSVHARKNGKVIFINLSPPAESAWRDIIDYWINMDCDAWVEDVQRRRADIFLKQKPLDWNIMKVNEKKDIKTRKRLVQEDDHDDKENIISVEPVSLVKSSHRIASQSGPQRATKLPQTPQSERVTKVFGESQLPTPPSTRHRLLGRTMNLEHSIQHGLDTPSKRRKTKDIPIHCDPEEDREGSLQQVSNDDESSISQSVIVAVPVGKNSTSSALKRKRLD